MPNKSICALHIFELMQNKFCTPIVLLEKGKLLCTSSKLSVPDGQKQEDILWDSAV